jgi:hypothetical protein
MLARLMSAKIRPHPLQLAISACACAALAGCATAGAPPTTEPVEQVAYDDGGDTERPALASLPALPQGSAADTARSHQGLLIARATLDETMPEPPIDRSYSELQKWVDTQVVSWIERRRAQTAETRDRFRLEGAPNPSELALSHAVVGLIHEDTAFSLRSIPAPSELESEPEIAEMYREIVSVQADTFVSSALLEFRDCANGAYGTSDMRPFAEFCHARFDRLQSRLKRK